MCDTLGFRSDGISYFAKNSDRGPNEPQILEFHPASDQKDSEVACTYRRIPQVAHTYAVLLSRPVWMWGAEMGVNEFGVVIGNEAVWTKGSYNKENVLTGMDLLRLALERSKTASEARDTIISLLEQYGQGGNCGFDHDFFYDNSFLIMDPSHIFILETAGKAWVWKETERGSISNRLSIRKEGEKYSAGKTYDFAGRHADPVFNLGSGSAPRLRSTAESLGTARGLDDLMTALRRHDKSVSDPFSESALTSVCMHFGGMVGDHTTQSLAVELRPEGEGCRILVWATGSSCPCVSLFKPWEFGTDLTAPFFGEEDESAAQAYWRSREAYNRSLLGKELPADFSGKRDELERSWLKKAEALLSSASSAADSAALARECLKEEEDFFRSFAPASFKAVRLPAGFRKRWADKNRVFE